MIYYKHSYLATFKCNNITLQIKGKIYSKLKMLAVYIDSRLARAQKETKLKSKDKISSKSSRKIFR